MECVSKGFQGFLKVSKGVSKVSKGVSKVSVFKVKKNTPSGNGRLCIPFARVWPTAKWILCSTACGSPGTSRSKSVCHVQSALALLKTKVLAGKVYADWFACLICGTFAFIGLDLRSESYSVVRLRLEPDWLKRCCGRSFAGLLAEKHLT